MCVWFSVSTLASSPPWGVRGYKTLSIVSATVAYLLLTAYFWLGTGSRLSHHAPSYKVERSKVGQPLDTEQVVITLVHDE